MPRKKQVVKEEPKKEPFKIRVPYYWLFGLVGIVFLFFLIFYGNSNSDVGDYMTSRPKQPDLKFNADVSVNETTETEYIPPGTIPSMPFINMNLLIAMVGGVIIANTMFLSRDIMMKVATTVGTSMILYYALQYVMPAMIG